MDNIKRNVNNNQLWKIIGLKKSYLQGVSNEDGQLLLRDDRD